MMAVRRDGALKEGLAPFRLRRMSVAVLHPGEMGAAVAACLGPGVIWAPEGRSAATAERARGRAPGDPVSADGFL
jgi:hypothetical protein